MCRMIFRAAAVLLFAAQIWSVASDDSVFYASRRQAVIRKIEASLVVLQGAPDTRAYEQFRQNNDFYYLSGVDVPGAMLLIDGVEKRSLLFLPPRNRIQELWEGARLGPGEEARASTGFDEVLDVGRFAAELEKRSAKAKAIYTPMKAEETASTSRDRATQFDAAQENNPWDGRVSRAKAFEQNLKKKLGRSVEISDLSPILDSMRRVKDSLEIERMRDAGRIGAQGIKEAIRATKAGLYEYQIAALAEFYFKWNGAMGPAYFPVVGSGPNSCVLHYHANSRQMETDDIVVMDFAPDYRYYHSDITRTFPVSGVFAPEQSKVYQVVLEAQKAALKAVRPGVSFGALNDAAMTVIRAHGYSQYWKHGLSHYVGMSTHDVGDVQALEPGVVITIEPGLYIAEKKLGVRIEDTVLVTKDGCEVLTGEVPKELQDVEHLMAEKTGGLLAR